MEIFFTGLIMTKTVLLKILIKLLYIGKEKMVSISVLYEIMTEEDKKYNIYSSLKQSCIWKFLILWHNVASFNIDIIWFSDILRSPNCAQSWTLCFFLLQIQFLRTDDFPKISTEAMIWLHHYGNSLNFTFTLKNATAAFGFRSFKEL